MKTEVEPNIRGFPPSTLTYKRFDGTDAALVDVVNGFDFDTSECSKVDLWFYGCKDEDYVYYERYILGIEDKLLLRGLLNKTTKITVTKFCKKRPLRARGNFGDLLSSMVTMRHLQSGGVPIHAACVALDGYAVLMPAMPSTGKTLTTLQMLNEGFDYLSDDSLIVDARGTAYCNPIPSAVSTHVLDAANRLSSLRRTELRIRSFVRKFPGIAWIIHPFMAKAWELVEGVSVAQNAQVTTICLLESGTKGIEEVDKGYALNKIVAINRYSLPQMQSNPVILAYMFFNPRFDLTWFQRREQELLSRILDKTECYVVRCRDGRWGGLVERVFKK